MANIPKNEDIRNRGDAQNLVTSIILRQHEMFSEEDIYIRVQQDLERSDFAENGAKCQEIDIKKMIEDTLHILYVHGCLDYHFEEKKYTLHMSFPAV